MVQRLFQWGTQKEYFTPRTHNSVCLLHQIQFFPEKQQQYFPLTSSIWWCHIVSGGVRTQGLIVKKKVDMHEHFRKFKYWIWLFFLNNRGWGFFVEGWISKPLPHLLLD